MPKKEPETPTPPQQGGGLGGQSELPPSIAPQGARDTRLIERAIRERWPIKEEWRAGLVARQVAIAGDKKSSPREATSAFRALLEADKINVGLDEREAAPVQVNVAIQNVLAGMPLDELQRLADLHQQIGNASEHAT